MAVTQLDLHRQGKAATLTDAEISATAAIALSKLAATVVKADGTQAFTGSPDAGSHTIVNVTDPVNPQDAATRAWVLTQLSGVPTSANALRVRTLATTNVASLSGTQTVQGVALSVNDPVALGAQTTGSANGVYKVNAGAWTRVPEADSWGELVGLLVVVEEGTNVADTLWLSTADAGGTLGTTTVTFIQLPGASDLIAGAGLTRTGQTINLIAGDASIVANADEIHVGVSGSGAITGGGALAVATDNTTIEINTNALRVKPGGIGETQLGAGTYLRVAKYIVRESPTGTINGANTSFALANTPVAGSEMVFLNGILQEPGAGNDYTIASGAITYLTAPATGDRLRVTYLSQ